MKLRYFICSAFLFFCFLLVFDIKIDDSDYTQTSLYFWGTFSGEEVIENRKMLQPLQDNLFIQSQFLNLIFSRRKTILPEIKIKEKRVSFKISFPKVRAKDYFVLKEIKKFYTYGPSELKFSLLISNLGRVKMIKKLNYTLSPSVDRIVENFLRSQIFQRKPKDYWKQVVVSLR